ncbi:MAG: PAS domain-containing protein [Verrucomicrobiaceae bacterium]|nr:PAS domain-containing protein [Verrucomicrobiaceae bacterium]
MTVTLSAPGAATHSQPRSVKAAANHLRRCPAPQKLYATLLDETQQGVIVVDPELRVMYANFAATLMFRSGTLKDEADLSENEETVGLRELLLQAIGSGRQVTGEIRLSLPLAQGVDEERIYRVVTAPVESADGAWCILDDVTDHVRTEQIRRDFVTNASHELRTPLSLIHGYIETLQSGLIKGGPSMQRCLEVMEKHSKRMMRIIEDLLTISRLEGGDAQLKYETFHVRACVEDVLEHLTPMIELRQPQITLDFPADGGVMNGDRFYWDQVFTNLIENALKENPRTGLHIKISGEWTTDEIVFVVSDDGIGIPPDDAPFVFKRFYRCGKDRAFETKGTGLGLSIVKRAVEAHGGTIDLLSIPNVETSFVMHVPARTSH